MRARARHRIGLARAAALTLACVSPALLAIGGPPLVADAAAEEARTIIPNPNPRTQAKEFEFTVFKKHCTQCHNSIADPERPGKTRDEWYAIINLMEGHGLRISQEEADMIVDLLYSLRRGIEDRPG